MPLISDSLDQFSHALSTGQLVNVTKEGKWYVECWLMRFIRWLFDLHGPRVRNIINAVQKILTESQRTPLQLNGDFEKYKKIIHAAKCAKKVLKEIHPFDYLKVKNGIKRNIVALSYWVGEKGGGFEKDTAINPETLAKITALADTFKKSLWQFKSEEGKLHPVDHKMLRQTALYPRFVKLLDKDKDLQQLFFSSIIRYLNPPEVFIEHPEVAGRLKDHHIIGSIGRAAYKNPLKILIDEANSTKTVTLPFDGDDRSILDPKGKIPMPEGEVPIQRMYDDMKAKDFERGEYTFTLNQGFVRFDMHKLAWWSVEKNDWVLIDVTKPRWWREHPDCEFNILKSDVMHRFELKTLADDEWVVFLGSAKSNERTRFDDCHGYAVIAIPNNDGTYDIIAPGKYPDVFPRGVAGYLGFITDTRRASIVVTDYNQTYNAIREHAGMVVVTNEAGGEKFLHAVETSIEHGRKGHSYFAFGWGNCAEIVQRWADKAFGKKSEGGLIPNLFLAPLTSAGCQEPLDSLIGMFKDLPEPMEKKLIDTTALTLGCQRSVDTFDEEGNPETLSMWTSPFHRGFDIVDENGDKKRVYQHIHLPSQMHRSIREGKFPGIIFSGFQRVQPESFWS